MDTIGQSVTAPSRGHLGGSYIDVETCCRWLMSQLDVVCWSSVGGW